MCAAAGTGSFACATEQPRHKAMSKTNQGAQLKCERIMNSRRSSSSSHSARGLQRRAPATLGVVDPHPQREDEEIRRTVAKISFKAERGVAFEDYEAGSSECGRRS